MIFFGGKIARAPQKTSMAFHAKLSKKSIAVLQMSLFTFFVANHIQFTRPSVWAAGRSNQGFPLFNLCLQKVFLGICSDNLATSSSTP